MTTMKTGWKKFGLWAVVLAALVAVVCGSQVVTAANMSTSEALAKMKEAGKIQLVTNAFRKCVRDRIERPYTGASGGLAENANGGIPLSDPFAHLSLRDITTGAWLEYQVQGRVNNGTIYCEDNNSNILNVFATTLNVSKNDVLCAGNRPGILKLQNQDTNGRWYNVDDQCAAGIGDSHLRFTFNDDAEDRVKSLYRSKWENNRRYLPEWYSIGTFTDDRINYFLYFNDFVTACSNGNPYEGDPSLRNPNDYYGPVKVPNPSTGEMEERYYPKGGASSSGNWRHSWLGDNVGAHTCEDVIIRINQTAAAVQEELESTTPDEGGQPTDIVGDITDQAGDSVDGVEESPCAIAGQSLGWIICPVIQLVSDAVEGIYGYIETNFLQLDASFVNSSNDTRRAWEDFRDFADIAFAIVLLVIILSQITGFGVSNYGIKKMLPSLIIVAILVNISFFLCQIAVDLSNIVGAGVKEIFTSLNVGNPEAVTLETIVNGLAETFLSAGATAGAVAGISFALENVENWILPLVLLLIIALIAVVFFFILLGVRQAGIIILITLSPVAIICYALPNTKKIFERWWKLFSALLLVYPICGLLVGGGQFASRLLLHAGSSAGGEGLGFAYAFVAVMLQVVPFFFIPSILKSSMAAMGNLGMKISNFGRGIGRGTTGAIRKSDAYKDAQERLRGVNARRQLNRMENNRGLRNRIGARLRRGDGRIARAAQNSYNERQRRLQDIRTEQELRNARARYASDGNHEQRLQNRLEAEHERYINGLAEEIELANTNIATDNNVLAARHAEALEAFNADPESDQNAAVVRAYQNMLNANGDGGRQRVFDNYAQNIVTHGEVRVGTQVAAQHMMHEHVGDIKPNSRDMFGFLSDVGNGQVRGTFEQFDARTPEQVARDQENGEDNPNMHWMSSYYGGNSVGGYDAASFARSDESTLDRYIAQARNGEFNDNQRTQLEEYTRKALDGQHNIHVQGKVAEKMNRLRDALGFSRVTAASNNSNPATGPADSGSLPIPRTPDTRPVSQIVQNPNGTVQGTVRADGVGTVRVRNGSTMTDSGIILPPDNPPRRRNNGPGR